MSSVSVVAAKYSAKPFDSTSISCVPGCSRCCELVELGWGRRVDKFLSSWNLPSSTLHAAITFYIELHFMAPRTTHLL